MGFGNADAGVPDLQGYGLFLRGHPDGDSASGMVILDGVVHQIEHNGADQLGDSLDFFRAALQGQLHLGKFRCRSQLRHLFPGGSIQIHRLPLHIRRPLVQAGQPENVLHQPDQPLGFGVDLLREADHVLPGHHSGFHQLGIAGNGMQGGFQLVRNIGGELPAQLLRLVLLGHIKQQHHHAEQLPIGAHRIGHRLVLSSRQGQGFLPLLAGEGMVHQGLDLRIPVCDGEIRSQAVGRDLQQGGCRRVDAQDGARGIQQHQALVQGPGDGIEFLLPLVQLGALGPQLPLLGIQPPQQGLNLRIAGIGQGVVQIQGVQGFHRLHGQPPGQHIGQGQHPRHNKNQALRHLQHQPQHRILGHRQPQNGAVRQQLGHIQ